MGALITENLMTQMVIILCKKLQYMSLMSLMRLMWAWSKCNSSDPQKSHCSKPHFLSKNSTYTEGDFELKKTPQRII